MPSPCQVRFTLLQFACALGDFLFERVAEIGECLLAPFPFGDIGIDCYQAAAGQRATAHLNDAAIGAHALQSVRLELAGQCQAFTDLQFDVSGAIFAALRVVAQKS